VSVREGADNPASFHLLDSLSMPKQREAAAAVPAVAGTAAFSKFMHVLQIVADAAEPMTMTRLVHASGYPRPTVHRIVAALTAEGLVAERPGGSGYGLGPRLLQLASRSWGRSELRLAAVDELKRLRDVTGETVHLAVPSGSLMVYIEKLESPSAVQMSSRIGTTVCLHATAVGKAFLAQLGEAERERLLDGLAMPVYTEKTLTKLPALRKQLDITRERGWSMDDEEHEPGIQCYGAAVLGADGAPLAAISVTTLRFRAKEDTQAAYVQPLLAACKAISAHIAAMPSLASARMV